jgi:hypothetical protein
MIIKIYIAGIILCILWWSLLAFAVFENKVYDLSDDDGKKSIDELIEVLNGINSNNPQLAYVILTIIMTLLWPIMVPYMIYKWIFK